MKSRNANPISDYFREAEYGWSTFWKLALLVVAAVFLFPFWLLGRIWLKGFVKKGN